MSVGGEVLIPDSILLFFQWMFYTVLTMGVDVFGTVSNVINILCLAKQGFGDIVNVSFLGLAISDLLCLLTLMWTNICMNPAFNELDLPFEPIEFQYLTGAWPHVIFTRVTSWITAFITLERCLCIALPLKVKLIFTHRRVLLIILGIFIFLISMTFPVYTVNRLAWTFSAKRNKTLIGLLFTEDREQVEKIHFAINNVFLQFAAFLTVVICTIVLVVKLRMTAKWRKKSTDRVDTSNRDQKVTKMVVAVSTLFIVCFSPICLIVVGMILEPSFSIEGKYRNLFLLLCSIGFFLESANSSMNIFIYYHMSTKYRTVFLQVILRKVN